MPINSRAGWGWVNHAVLCIPVIFGKCNAGAPGSVVHWVGQWVCAYSPPASGRPSSRNVVRHAGEISYKGCVMRCGDSEGKQL